MSDSNNASIRLPSTSSSDSVWSFTKLKALFSLTKPRLSTLVVLTAAAGYALFPNHYSNLELIILVIGTYMVVGAANVINCYFERDVDAFMERTKNRPLVTGLLTPIQALVFGLFLAVVGSLILLVSANALTAFLGLLGFVLYVGVYTPMKRMSTWSLVAGAVPGALPPMMGWTAQTNSLDSTAWLLFLILLFWQLPHFVAIALFRYKEYEAAGLKTLPGLYGEQTARWHMIGYSIFLVLITFLPTIFKQAGWIYFSGALFVGLGFCYISILSLKKTNFSWARVVFIGSLIYLPLVLGTWVIDSFVMR